MKPAKLPAKLPEDRRSEVTPYTKGCPFGPWQCVLVRYVQRVSLWSQGKGFHIYSKGRTREVFVLRVEEVTYNKVGNGAGNMSK